MGESPLHWVDGRPWYDAGANLNFVLYSLAAPVAHAVLGAGIALAEEQKIKRQIPGHHHQVGLDEPQSKARRRPRKLAASRCFAHFSTRRVPQVMGLSRGHGCIPY